jgi:hypothetical protein
MCIRHSFGSISGEQPPIMKDLGLRYFTEFAGVVDGGARGSFALKKSESKFSRFISFQVSFSNSSKPITVKGTTFGVPLDGSKHSV